jgi:1-acyl-sn-glycerol-3-phosphate acyltransferase
MLIAIVCFAALLLYWDLRMRFSYYIEGTRRHPERFDRLQSRGLISLLSVLRVYSGMRLERTSRLGGPLPPQFLILSNHQSLLDIPILAWAFRGRSVGFVAKAELTRGLPGLSFVLRKGRHALVPRRGDFRSAHRQLVRLARGIRQDVCPVIFPEGTRSRDRKVGPFHSAAVRTLLARRQIPVLAVALDGGGKVSRLMDILKNLGRCVYRVRLLRLYPAPADRLEVQGVIAGSHALITEQVETWTRTTK